MRILNAMAWGIYLSVGFIVSLGLLDIHVTTHVFTLGCILFWIIGVIAGDLIYKQPDFTKVGPYVLRLRIQLVVSEGSRRGTYMTEEEIIRGVRRLLDRQGKRDTDSEIKAQLSKTSGLVKIRYSNPPVYRNEIN